MIPDGQIASIVSSYGYWGVAGLVGLESMGVPLPGETALIAAALVAGTSHTLDIWWVIVAAISGAIIGDNVGYWIGKTLGYRVLLRHGRLVHLDERRLKLGQYLFLRWGGAVVFFARFMALLRALGAVLAGASRMPWPRFLLFNALGAIVWAGLFGFGAYLLGHSATTLARPLGIALAVVAVIAVSGGLLVLRRYEAKLSQQAEAALPSPLAPAANK